jgi:hypothetical protein
MGSTDNKWSCSSPHNDIVPEVRHTIHDLPLCDPIDQNPLMAANDNNIDWIRTLPAKFKQLLDDTPDNLQDSALILYFRCKYDERDELKQIFSSAERDRIDSELERIDKLRSTFAQRVDNNPLVRSMIVSRRFWRNYAKDLCRRSSERERVETISREAPTEEKRRRYRCYIRADGLLERVGNWIIPPDNVRPTTSLEEDVDKGYGFVVQRITLKRNEGLRGSGTSSFGEYSLKTYPVHDVLYNKDKNPLTERCEENTIRYFHFPANCMLWVEVCNSSDNQHIILISCVGGNWAVLQRRQRRI